MEEKHDRGIVLSSIFYNFYLLESQKAEEVGP